MLPDIEELDRLVRNIGRDELLPRFAHVRQEVKPDGSVLTEADLAVNRRFVEELSRRWPSIPILSEEMETERQARLIDDTTQLLWCLDPLDGTTNFAAGLPFFSISLALLAEGQPVIGMVYDPDRDEGFLAVQGQGTWLNGQRLMPRTITTSLPKAVALVDFKRLKAPLARRLAQAPPYGSQRNLGSCALEWAWIAAGRGHVYLHGGQKLWDRAAGALVLREAGGHASTLDGSSVMEASMTGLSVVASLNDKLFADWRDWLVGG